MEKSNISVLGLGYIGLPTAAVFASHGCHVIGVDINQDIVNTINAGDIHITEPGLDEVVRDVVSSGHLRATTKVEPSDVFFITVPTPFTDSYKPNLDYVRSAAKSISPVLNKGNVVILESTSPVGTTEEIRDLLSSDRPDLTFPNSDGNSPDVCIAYCPERVLPGKILVELIENDRIIGGLSARCSDRAEKVYKVFVTGNCLKTDSKTAEMAKLTENAYRDVNIAFANELSVVCDDLDIDVWELIGLANRHPRVDILNPGPGVGGHCIAIDPWFIVDSSPDNTKLIQTAREVNDSKPHWVVDKVKKACKLLSSKAAGNPKLKIACLGITFKANIDDIRQSPAIKIVRTLIDEGLDIAIVEPNVESLPENLISPNVKFMTLNDAIESSDIILLLVDHTPFLKIDDDQIGSKLLIDTRGVYSSAKL